MRKGHSPHSNEQSKWNQLVENGKANWKMVIAQSERSWDSWGPGLTTVLSRSPAAAHAGAPPRQPAARPSVLKTFNLGFASKPWWFCRPPTLVSLVVSPAGGLSGLSAFSVHLPSRGLLPLGWGLGVCKGGGALSGEEAGKQDGQGKKPSKDVVSPGDQPQPGPGSQGGELPSSPARPRAPQQSRSWLPGSGAVTSRGRGLHWPRAAPQPPFPAAGGGATAQGGGSWQSASSTGICLSLWCVFQRPKRISPAPRGLDLKSNHPKHSTEM